MSKCKICKSEFKKLSLMHRTCSLECSLKLVAIEKAKKIAKEDRVKKISLRSRRDWLKLAQVAFNTYIRERDKKELCICCDRPLSLVEFGGSYDCGHYRSIGSAPHLRFDERNAHAQSKQCNRWGSGRAVDYRLGLIKRIGLESVESLESDQTPRKHTIEDLQAIIKEYKIKLNLLKGGA